MFWIALASLVLGALLVKLGALSVIVVVMLLALKAAVVVILALTGNLVWRKFRQRRLPGGNHEYDHR
jgi:uncharacterized membrane-anchored protein